MNTLEVITPAHFFMEIGHDSLRIFNGAVGLDLPVGRLADGHLTESCKNHLLPQLQRFIGRKSWQPRPRVFCAVGARGVSLRQLSLPAASKEELHRLLPLQIESEFPLPPEQLAWGYQLLGPSGPLPGSAGATQALLVAAVRKDSLEDYANLLAQCGASPIFTIAALARTYVCPKPPTPYALLNLSSRYSELITLNRGVPVAVRVLAWGRENLLRPAEKQPGNGGDQAPAALASALSSFGVGISAVPEALPTSVFDPLVRLLNGQSLGHHLYLTGIDDLPAELNFAKRLAACLGNGVECLPVEPPSGPAGSLAVLGLQQAIERGEPPLVLQLEQDNGTIQLDHRAPLKRVAFAVGLLLLALLLPYAEAITLKSHLAGKLASIKTEQSRLGIIDRELDFLQYLKENEPPYLDALLVFARAAPPGTRLDSVSMNRRGDVSLRGSFRDPQQVADFRTKLIDSGFFGSVSIEEQAPTPDRQKLNVRISSQWKPVASRTSPVAEPVQPPGRHRGQPAQTMPGTPPTPPALPPPNATSSRGITG